MTDATFTALSLFALVWVLTFVPSWKILLKLIALSASPMRMTLRFWAWLFLYRVLIAAPYIVLLFIGADVIPTLIQILIVGFLVTGFALSILRFVFRDQIIGALWWVYGFVYDGLLHYAPYRRLTKAVIESLKAARPNARRILELGCGTGNVITGLKENFRDSEIVGVDSSSSMIQVARKKHAEVEIIRQDIDSYLDDQPDGAYDAIVMQNVLYVVSDRSVLWKQLHRVVSEDGVVVITNSDRAGSSTITKEHLKYGKSYELLHPKLLCVGIIDAFISQLSKSGSFSFISEEQIHKETEGMFEMSNVKRVYGDVNILFTLKKRTHV